MTKSKNVRGILLDMKVSPAPHVRTITFRITCDEWGKSFSLADESRGLMLQVPFDAVEKLLEWGAEYEWEKK